MNSLITKTPGVCGGRACVARTRMPVWSLVRHKQLGFDDDLLLTVFPSMSHSDLDAAWQYFLSNRDEILRDIAENEQP